VLRRTRAIPRLGCSFGVLAPQDQKLAQVLHRGTIEFGANPFEHRLSRIAVIVENAHLDELVREQRKVDLVQHLRRQPMMADADHDAEMVSAGTKRAPQSRVEGLHARQCRREGKRAKRAARQDGPELSNADFTFLAGLYRGFPQKRAQQAMRGTFYSPAFSVV